MKDSVKASLLAKAGAKKQAFTVSNISTVKVDKKGNKFVVLTFALNDSITDYRDGKEQTVDNFFLYEDKVGSLVNGCIQLFGVRAAMSLGILTQVLSGARIELISIPVKKDEMFSNPITGKEELVNDDNIYQFFSEVTLNEKTFATFNEQVMPIIKEEMENLMRVNIRKNLGLE